MNAAVQWLRSVARPLAYRLDLRGRLMVLAMMPVIVFAIAWGAYVVHQRDTDLRAQLQQRAQLLARQMAIAADYGIFSGERMVFSENPAFGHAIDTENDRFDFRRHEFFAADIDHLPHPT